MMMLMMFGLIFRMVFRNVMLFILGIIKLVNMRLNGCLCRVESVFLGDVNLVVR